MSIILTNQNYDGSYLPRSVDESKRVAPGTPLALVGLFMLAIRERFSYNSIGGNVLGGGTMDMPDEHTYSEEEPETREELPWVWDNSLRPSAECPPPEDPDAVRTKILIDSAFNIHRGTHNYRPAIYVDHGNTIAQKVVVDNRAGNHLPSGLAAYYCMAQTEMIVSCSSENPGESSILGDTVWFFLLATRDIFRHDFGLHDMTEPILGKTTPDEEDKEVWKTQINFSVVTEMRWAVRPIAPLISDIALAIRKDGVTPDTYYQRLVLRRSLRD